MSGPPLLKPSRTARKIAEVQARAKRVTAERSSKSIARKRDGYRCRFPLCGCKALGLALDARAEVSHDRHKGMGGNPSGDRSTPELLITLCRHRHQDGAISRHKGTLRTRYLTDKKNDGPVAWEVDSSVWNQRARVGWIEVAREKAVQVLGELTAFQRGILERLAEMDL